MYIKTSGTQHNFTEIPIKYNLTKEKMKENKILSICNPLIVLRRVDQG